MSAPHENFDVRSDLPRSAERALRFPVGVVSPLWFLYAGATSAGMAYWLMTRWARPVNLEALLGREGAVAAAPVAEALEGAVEIAETAVAAVAEEAEASAAKAEQVLEAAAEAAPVQMAAAEPVVEAAPAPPAAPEPVVEAAVALDPPRETPPEPAMETGAPPEPEPMTLTPPEPDAPRPPRTRSAGTGTRPSSRSPSGSSRRG